jgi:cytochrome P450
VISNQFFTNNPPLHGPIRKTLFNQISPKQTALMEDLARDTARGILAECAHQSEIDFTSDIAEKLTARFWGSILGMTPQEVVDVAAAVHDLTPLFFMDRSAEDTTRLERGAARYGQLVEGAAMRSVSGGGGHPMLAAIASALTNLDFAEDLATVGIVPRNVGAFMAGNLVDGFHTAALAATNTLYTLLRFPEVLAQVRAAPELLPRAILEALRLEPPVLMLKRYVLQDVTYDGMLIPKGTLISMMWAAGNHDPSVFADPTQFNLTRSHQGITIFGGGTHICPGRYVALMLTRILIEALDTNGIALELVDHACHWYDGHVMAQLKAMPVKIKSSQR